MTKPRTKQRGLWELLDSVDLTYYDRLEWLIRTDLRAAVDSLIVERARDVPRKSEAEKDRSWNAFWRKASIGMRL